MDELLALAANARAKAVEAAEASVAAADIAARLGKMANEFSSLASGVEAAIAQLAAIDDTIDAAGKVIK